MSTVAKSPPTLDTAETLAADLGVVPTTVLKWARRGIIPAVRVGRKFIRFDREQVYRALVASGGAR